MVRALIISILFTLLIPATGCDSWVEDVDRSEGRITDDLLTSEDQVDFPINGVLSQFDRTNSQAALQSANLSDELFTDSRNLASSVSYEEIDSAVISLVNGTVGSLFDDIGRLRFLADDLARRAGEIHFTDQGIKRRAEYTGYLYGAIARFYLAAYYGLTEREGGGVITYDPAEPGPFIPSSDMYELALEKLEMALSVSAGAESRILNTLKARIYLVLGDFGKARSAAQLGMAPLDQPFQSLYDGSYQNGFYTNAGPAVTRLFADNVYKEYVDADPAEAARIPLSEAVLSDSTVLYRQDRYNRFSDPIDFCTWQENELILAELDLLDSNSSGALMHINAERASHGLDDLMDVNMTVLEIERRKELWMMGLRLIDQRRFGSWHKGPGTWWNFPIPQNERDLNPNF